MGFWKTLGKIGSFAAPIVAAPFTGGASLALIGAGAGAAGSALSGGGLKGALMGAGLGAIPGLGGMGKAAGAATGQATGGGMLGALSKAGKFLGKPGVMDAIGGGAELLAGGAKAAKEGRMDEADLQARMNSANNRSSLEAASFNADRERALMRRAIAARMMGDLGGPTDARDRFGGGGTSPMTQAMLSRYGDMADAEVTSGSYRQKPTVSSIPKAGFMENLGGIAGTAGGMLGILGKSGLLGGRSGSMTPMQGGAVPGVAGTPLEPNPGLAALRAQLGLDNDPLLGRDPRPRQGYVNPTLGARF
jgi:hypothetical protein